MMMVQDKVRRGRGVRGGPGYYYGFAPEQAFLIRSRVRTYTGVTERFQFANGQSTAYPMREDATEEQKIARGERLARLRGNSSYQVYEYGQEPPPTHEPLWEGQTDPNSVVVEIDTGESVRMWAPVAENRPAVRMPVEGPTPSGQTSREIAAAHANDDTGEDIPKPVAPEPEPSVLGWERSPDARE